MDAVQFYKKIGANVIHVPGGANHYIFKQYDCEQDIDVNFIGKNKGYRKDVIKTIVDEGIDIRVYGRVWNMHPAERIGKYLNALKYSQDKYRKTTNMLWSDLVWYTRHFSKTKKIFGPYLPIEGIAEIFNRSKITLGSSGAKGTSYTEDGDINKSVKALKGRDFEAPLCGAFYITEHVDAIAQLYEIGEEIETFKNVPELVDKIKYYLENPDEIDAIGKAGRERALREYTWEKCIEKVFDKIGIE
jgi:spore maturation protein CgeB